MAGTAPGWEALAEVAEDVGHRDPGRQPLSVGPPTRQGPGSNRISAAPDGAPTHCLEAVAPGWAVALGWAADRRASHRAQAGSEPGSCPAGLAQYVSNR
jgi:hypothetical protein